MYRYVTRVRAALPYEPPGVEARYLRIDLDLDRLTVLLGPNASGKTAVLESIGYITSSLLEASHSALGLSLTTTFRPRKFMPSPISGSITLDESHTVSNLCIELTHPLLLKTDDRVKEMVRTIPSEKASALLHEMEKDINRNGYSILELEEILKRLSIFSLMERERAYSILIKLITDIIGQDIDIAASYSLRRPVLKTQKEVIRRILLYRPTKVKISYSLFDGLSSISKAFVIENVRGIVVVKKRRAETVGYPRIAVFHPGFIYWQGVFESLYYAYVHEGLVNEKDSIRILKNYIEWIDGYELIGSTLHVRTIDGKRRSVYNLSDGQRVAIFMGLLYAISKPPLLFLIDTPEAFVHPDGLPTIADLIAHLVAEDNQVIVATQSIEFLEELLVKAREHGVLDHVTIQRLALTREGVVKVRSRWSGEVGLKSIEELGADLRR